MARANNAGPGNPECDFVMPEFDPYYTWLGIPPKDQPPNHYRLLGIELLEENADVIAISADRQMGFLRTFQTGRHSADSQRLLSEIATARRCLLDAAAKAAYDEQLVGGSDDVSFDSIDDLPEVELIDDDPSAIVPLPPPGPPPAPQRDAELGTVGNYQMLRGLDKSKSGAVFKARHLKMDRVVAVKILSQHATESEQLHGRFRRKVKILGRLSHPNLIAIHNAGDFKGRPYMEMEYIDGRNLAQLIADVGPLPIEHAVNYTRQAAAGLALAHDNGVYHRNVKPSNLLVENATGVIKVIGLGLARMTGPLADENSFQQMLTTPGMAMGTLDYMAPEQYTNASGVDHRADIYSLGCTLYTLLAGAPPYPVKSPMKKLLAHRDAPIPPLATANSVVSAALETAYQKMMAKKPEDRFQSMNDVTASLAVVF